MTLSVYDVFGNVVSIILVLMMPITSRLFNSILKMKDGFEGGEEDAKTYKAFMSYERNFSFIFTSLFFSLSNTLYLMLKDGLRWKYVIFGFSTFILLTSLILMNFYLNQFNIDQPLTQSIHDKFDCNFRIDEFQSFPIWARVLWYVNPTRLFVGICLLSYVIPSLIVLRQIGYV